MKMRSLVPMIISDVIILGLLLCTYVLWDRGYVEKRNDRIPNKVVNEQTVDDTNFEDQVEEQNIEE